MYFNGTKCQLLLLSCFMSASLLAKDVKTLNARGLQKPLTFIENKGQVLDGNNHSRKDIQFRLATNGLSLFLGKGSLHYQFRNIKHTDKSADINSYQMNVTLLGADPNAKMVASDQQEYYENYFLDQTATDGVTAHAYNKVTYCNVYPNIDWVLYVKGNNVEYDFVVRPGGNVNDIKIKYDGATTLAMTANGGILATTPMGDVTEKHPVAFETATGKSVASKFSVHDNVVSFETGNYNGSLTIDPFLNWSTYIGGGNEDRVTALKCGPGGETYACGYTASTDLPVSGGPYQSSNNGSHDAFLARYNSGGALAFTTYFGGTGNDEALAMAVSNAATRVYLTGRTTSTTSIASGGAYHTALSGSGTSDMFLVRFNNTGTTRTFGTYIGGTGDETGYAVACDASGNVYVGGVTTSTTASTIVAGTPYQGSFGGGATDGYLARFTSGGAISWATYYGGGDEDEIDAIAVDLAAAPTLVLTGTTKSLTAIASASGAQSGFGGGTAGATDAFVTSFASTAATCTRNWGTYLGASGTEQGLGIDCDVITGDVYVTGNTTSTDSIAYGLSYQRTYGGGAQDAYLVKYSSAGAIKFGTYLGGSSAEFASGVTVDAFRNVVITGATFSSSGIAAGIPYQSSIGGSEDAYIGKFNYYGQNIYTSYFGKGGLDYPNGITTDPNNSAIIIGGFTNSPSGFATAGAAQTTIGGGSSTYHDGFVTRFYQDTLVWVKQPFKDTTICPGGTLIVHDTTIFSFQTGNVFTVQLSDASGSFASPVNIGTATATSAGNITCTIPAGTPLGASYRIRIASSNPYYISPDNILNIAVVNPLPAQTVSGSTPVCVGAPIHLFDSAPYEITGYSWTGPSGSGYTSTAQNPVIPGSSVTSAFGGIYTVTTTHNGCPAVSNTFSVTVNSFHPPAPTVTATTPICGGSTLALTAAPGMTGTFTYSWTGPGGFSSTLQNPTRASISIATGSGNYIVRDTLGGCESAPTTVNVSVLPNATPTINISVTPNDTVCIGTMVHFTSTTTLAGYSPTFQWYSNATTPITGATFDYYNTSTWPLGTSISCRMVSTVACPVTPYATSNVINMDIINNTPVIHLTATPDTFIGTGGTVTFHTTVAGSLFTTRTWYVNNHPINDSLATGTLTLTHITHNDTVRYEVTSGAICANIGASNTLIVRITNNVANVSPAFLNIDLFPNPNTGSFGVKGTLDGISAGTVDMQVTNTLGQVIYNGNTEIVNGQIDNSINLGGVAPGMYILRINKDGEGKVFRFMVD